MIKIALLTGILVGFETICFCTESKTPSQNEDKAATAEVAPAEKKEEAPAESTATAMYKKVYAQYRKDLEVIEDKAEEVMKNLKTRMLGMMERQINQATREMKLDDAEKMNYLYEKFRKEGGYQLPSMDEEEYSKRFQNLIVTYRKYLEETLEKREVEAKKISRKYKGGVEDMLEKVSARGDLQAALNWRDFKEELENILTEQKDPDKKTVAQRRCPGKVGGLRCSIYLKNGKVGKVTEINSRRPEKVKVVSDMDIPVECVGKDYFSLYFKGFVYVREKGEYTFSVSSDDGTILYIDGKEVVNNDGAHAKITKTGSIVLTSGWHRLELGYFDNIREEILEVKMGLKGKTASKIPAKYLAY